ncbi:MAG: hypothetical protein Q4B93_03690 [Clostridia bacterium]|nr:hypothetical protein [Clostridia bacterium]
MGKWCDCFRDDLVDDINTIVDNNYDPERLNPLSLSPGSGSSVDEEEVAVTMHSMIHPNHGDNISEVLRSSYNCWSWSVSPLTHRLKWIDPPGIKNVKSVEDLAHVVSEYLRNNRCTFIQCERDNILEHLTNLNENQFVIAMRTGKPAQESHPISYHFARYIFGQWSYKDGGIGRLIMATSQSPTFEPDSFWKEHDDLKHRPTGTRRFPRNSDDTVRRNHFVYDSKTIYLVVTLPDS